MVDNSKNSGLKNKLFKFNIGIIDDNIVNEETDDDLKEYHNSIDTHSSLDSNFHINKSFNTLSQQSPSSNFSHSTLEDNIIFNIFQNKKKKTHKKNSLSDQAFLNQFSKNKIIKEEENEDFEHENIDGNVKKVSMFAERDNMQKLISSTRHKSIVIFSEMEKFKFKDEMARIQNNNNNNKSEEEVFNYDNNIDKKSNINPIFKPTLTPESFKSNFRKNADKIPQKSKFIDTDLKKVKKIGSGSFGNVYKVVDSNKKFYALKKYFYNKELLLENKIQMQVNILKDLSHTCIPKIFKYWCHKEKNYMLQEYYPVSLNEIINLIKEYEYYYSNNESDNLHSINPNKIMNIEHKLKEIVSEIENNANNTPKNLNEKSENSEINKSTKNCITNNPYFKKICYEIIQGVNFIHNKKVLHRDLKPSNIMISSEGIIKLIDFDMIRKIDHINEELSLNVGSLYYKPIEILFGNKSYGFSLDNWAIGCILAEMYLGYPLFKGNGDGEIAILNRVTEVLGSIEEELCTKLMKTNSFFSFNNPKVNIFDILFKDCNLQFKNLVKDFLRLDPDQRLTTEISLDYEYFKDFQLR